MNYTSIKEIERLEAGAHINRMRATVEQTFRPNKFKTGTMQAAILNDGTGKIRAAFWGTKIPLDNYKGNEIEIVSGKNKNGNFAGIEATDWEKDGKIERQIKVSQHATIDEVVGDSSEGTGERPSTGQGDNGDRQVSKAKLPAYEDENVKRRSIERQQALDAAIAFLSKESPSPQEVVSVAETFYSFISAAPIPFKVEKSEPIPFKVEKSEPDQQEAPAGNVI